MLLTGPNMGGKSTLLRAVCVAAVVAHVGGWVPAARCEMPVLDAVFVRMGAQDRLLRGQSTFLVECLEAADVLRHATDASLVRVEARQWIGFACKI